MPAARVPQPGGHAAERDGQRTHPGKSFPRHRASSCTHCLWDRLHEPRELFLLEWRTPGGTARSSSCSCLSRSVWTASVVSYPTIFRQVRREGFPTKSKSRKTRLIFGFKIG